jgi:hypothetical protein
MKDALGSKHLIWQGEKSRYSKQSATKIEDKLEGDQ